MENVKNVLSDYVPLKEREIKQGDSVQIYRNLRNGKMSIKVGTHVHGYADFIVLENATFHVSEEGRQRVLKEKRKNVHAVVKGKILLAGVNGAGTSDTVKGLKAIIEEMDYQKIVYNPYFHDTFKLFESRINKETVTSAKYVIVLNNEIFAHKPE